MLFMISSPNRQGEREKYRSPVCRISGPRIIFGMFRCDRFKFFPKKTIEGKKTRRDRISRTHFRKPWKIFRIQLFFTEKCKHSRRRILDHLCLLIAKDRHGISDNRFQIVRKVKTTSVLID